MATMQPLLFEETVQPMAGQLATAADVLAYALAGNATLTICSKSTGTRFTYKVRESDKDALGLKRVWFVSLMRGPDNENDFSYMGILTQYLNGNTPIDFKFTKKSTVQPDAPSAVAWVWAWERLAKGHMPSTIEVWHTGRCGRCGRKLTVPESVARGIGPECASKMGGL